MKNEKTRWFGIPKLFPYLKGYGRLVLVDMVALGFQLRDYYEEVE